MRLGNLALVIAVVTALLPACAGAPVALGPAAQCAVTLPPARTDGTMAVEKALQERRSLRKPAPTPLTLQELAQLSWAAQGVTDDKGHRTAPSARASYPLELYVVVGAVHSVGAGFYHYEPASHSLRLMAAGDRRAELVDKAIGQTWVAQAPVMFVITGVLGRMSRMKERGPQFMNAEVGLAAQGLFLQATALGMGSTYIGGFDPVEAHRVLGLRPEEEVLGIFPVGRRQ